MANPAETYRQKLQEEMYMEHYESRRSDLYEVLEEEWNRVKKRNPLEHQKNQIVDCSKCLFYQKPPQVCNLCRKGQIKQLKIDLADLFKEYQDIAGIHNTTYESKDKRIALLEDVLRHSRGRLALMDRSTLAIDIVLEKKGE